MKKNINLIVLLIVIAMSSCVTTMTNLSDEEYSTEINLNKSKDSLFVECNLWAINVFNSAKSVIQYSDKEYGVVSGKYIMESSEYNGVHAIFTIYVDNNYSKLIIKPYGTSFRTKKQLYDKIYEILKSYNNYFNCADPEYEFKGDTINNNNNNTHMKYIRNDNPFGR